ncbi:hypothetical protein AYJ08_19960 [Brevibacillus sp. SKDU10]|uniref:TOMM precursor leader peptide-binding protein n=1 Tax=Brevibacillus sp. SKDU10 TaxID=1247872 RepID=UPI0007C890CF|nr:TOMM precursor leader peptide-binding protein [Brevibacillus sp. SKDU10]OAJ76157.1 hypothetical protein AYJ08_19960 [Brevibacillus sp. SKDU10]
MKPIHVIAVGTFGTEVANQIVSRAPETVVTHMPATYTQLPTHLFPVARIHVLASWRAVSQLSNQMDEYSYRWKIPWLPVVMDHPYLRIGPFVDTSEGACYHCFEKRYLQHSPTPEYIDALNSYYDAHPEAGPKGFLRVFASLSAAQVIHLEKCYRQESTSISGSLWQINILTSEPLQTQVIGVHGCPRCGLGRQEEDRSVAQLRVDLKNLIKEPTISKKELIQS